MEHQLVEQSLVVRLAGELDLVDAAAFRQLVNDMLDRRKARHLLVNLEQITFLDSSFLGALLGAYRRFSQAGGRMMLVRVPPPVRPTLELSGVFRIMQEYPSEPEALAAG